jgi:tetratricopeptide (TPR) repeat protein
MSRPLRFLAIGSAIACAAFLADGRIDAQAAWCGSSPSGGRNCSFSTLDRCVASMSQSGGSCTQSAGPAENAAEPDRDNARRERAKRAKKEAEPKRHEPVTPPVGPAAAPPPAAPPLPAAAMPRPVPASATAQPGQQPAADFASARQLILTGQYDAGIAAMRALQFDDHPDVAAFLGLAYRKLGRVEEARTWYERALAADPNHRLALSYYGMMRAETGDTGKARENLERLKLICGGTDCNEYRALAGVISSQPR